MFLTAEHDNTDKGGGPCRCSRVGTVGRTFSALVRYVDCDLSGRWSSLDLAFDELLVRTPVGLDQHVVDVADEYVAFFRDAGLQQAAVA